MRYLLLTILTIIYLTPTSVVAQTYDDSILRAERGLGAPTYDTTARPGFVPLVNIPFLNELQIEQENLGLAGYANSLYRAAITIAAVLAVIKIVMAGVQYMLTDVVTQKSDAKKNIKNALLGLTIVIGAVLILNTINPSLTNLEVLNLQQLSGDLGTINIAGRGTATPSDQIDISTATPEQIANFIEACEADREGVDQKFVYKQYSVAGKLIGRCEFDVERIISNNTEEIEEFKNYCHDSGRLYDETTGSGGTIISCIETTICENGIDRKLNRCVVDQVLDEDGNPVTGEYSYSCIDPVSLNPDFACTDFCIANGGAIQGGNCLGANAEYVKE